MLKENRCKLYNILDKYSLDQNSKSEFLSIAIPIIEHEEFQKRMSNLFLHHSDITLGEHIIEDAVVTYILSKKKNKKKEKVNINLSVTIALLHDLYTVPWQNNKKNTKVKKFSNKHGFRHPIEAVINAYLWYPFLFKNEFESKIIIDGIIHHMYPLPVTRLRNVNYNYSELKNFDKFDELPLNIKQLIFESSNRFELLKLSFCRSKYLEGRIMSKADKKVSFHQIKNVHSATALITGKNKSIDK